MKDMESMNQKKGSYTVLENKLQMLLQEYRDQIYGFAYKNLKSHSLSQDIVQEIFLVLCSKDLSNIQNIRSYIFQITQHKVVDHLRRKAKNQSLRQEMWEVIEEKQKAVDQVLIEKEYFEHLKLAKTQLSPQQKLIFEMSRNEGLSHRKIAEKMGLSQNTVKNHMVAALKTLREYMLTHSDIILPFLIIFSYFLR